MRKRNAGIFNLPLEYGISEIKDANGNLLLGWDYYENEDEIYLTDEQAKALIRSIEEYDKMMRLLEQISEWDINRPIIFEIREFLKTFKED